MEALTSIVDLAQAGGVAILLVITWQLWQRLNAVSDRFMAYLEKRDEMGDTAAQTVRTNMREKSPGIRNGADNA